ncbi:MAG: NAD(P)H dehydrogenase [Rubrivivax sp.]|nr:MAG: NAD(P)H dehydrogenase [Rubrivivax sp.]
MPSSNRPLNLLHLDASARHGRGGIEPHGSWTRRLSDAFVQRWLALRPQDTRTRRDLALQPPQPMPAHWVQAAFTPQAEHDIGLQAVLAESDRMVAEVRAADVLVIGMPMYNYGMPAPLKAWADLVVRYGETFKLVRQPGEPTSYQPLLTDRPRRAVLLTSRGAEGFGPGGPYAAFNHADPALRGVLAFIGITDVEVIALEGEESGAPRFEAAVQAALAQTQALATRWAGVAEHAEAA